MTNRIGARRWLSAAPLAAIVFLPTLAQAQGLITTVVGSEQEPLLNSENSRWSVGTVGQEASSAVTQFRRIGMQISGQRRG